MRKRCCCCHRSRSFRFGNTTRVSKHPYRENTRITVKQFILHALETITDYIRAVLPEPSNQERPLSINPTEKVRSWIRDSFVENPRCRRHSPQASSSSSSSDESKSIQRKRRRASVKGKRGQSPTETITILSSSSAATENSTRQE